MAKRKKNNKKTPQINLVEVGTAVIIIAALFLVAYVFKFYT